MSDTLLCWHAERAGLDVLEGALGKLAERGIQISRVMYLIQAQSHARIPPSINDARVEPIRIDLVDPTRHQLIYEAIQEQVLPRLNTVAGRLHLNLSPGTPAMHSVWLILHAGGVFAPGTRLWSSQPDRLDPVQFEVSTYLAEIRRQQRLDPKVPSYNPEARSAARREAMNSLFRYARVTGAPLLILGERGTGKSRLVETQVATLKQRPNKVVTLACGGLESTLAESLLFGHVKGAFTGAVQERKGLLAQANGGILFLDEIQDLPRPVQRQLVRVFQDRKRRYRPIGSDKEISVDFELVCASNLPMGQLRERLDEDLCDRLSHLCVSLPALRDCREDLHEDWQRVWGDCRVDADLPVTAPWSNALAKRLSEHPLTGNLRDLQRLAALCMAWFEPGNEAHWLDKALQQWSGAAHDSSTAELIRMGSREEQTKYFHAELALRTKATEGSWKAAAKALDCSVKTLQRDAEGYRGLPEELKY
ncbi:sigma-54-dependent transcriptional regulator [Pseudomonas capsici]|uniref:sigma-54-dependent transcriptional regulator n=1 Tax=Pseudomonas capsici TaxID=2810614 RepID=UPI0021F24D17|nr:sigma 54-interacting transcriptional regulator [Pseudomonas capsici]MCV4263501.1 sigma 54-interacting transcriptional regulator [Pseudomonas capsici]